MSLWVIISELYNEAGIEGKLADEGGAGYRKFRYEPLMVSLSNHPDRWDTSFDKLRMS